MVLEEALLFIVGLRRRGAKHPALVSLVREDAKDVSSNKLVPKVGKDVELSDDPLVLAVHPGDQSDLFISSKDYLFMVLHPIRWAGIFRVVVTSESIVPIVCLPKGEGHGFSATRSFHYFTPTVPL